VGQLGLLTITWWTLALSTTWVPLAALDLLVELTWLGLLIILIRIFPTMHTKTTLPLLPLTLLYTLLNLEWAWVEWV
jgi:hypothetical protein